MPQFDISLFDFQNIVMICFFFTYLFSILHIFFLVFSEMKKNTSFNLKCAAYICIFLVHILLCFYIGYSHKCVFLFSIQMLTVFISVPSNFFLAF